MSIHVNFSTHGKEINDALQAVLSDNDPTNWLVLAYDKGTNDLRLQDTGDGGLEELNDEFFDGKMQYAYTRVIDPNTELPKYVFIAWCGSGVPETRKGFFNSHLSEVSRFFKSFHVQINARDEADVDPDLIMKRVSESSGANYSVHKEQRKPQPAITPVNSVYKKTEIPDIAAMQRESMRREGAPAPVGTNYKPVQTAPKPLASRWNAAQSQSDNGAAAVRAERERFEREQREREEQSARAQVQRDQDAEQQRAAAEEAEQQRRQQEEDERRRVEEQRRAAAAAAAEEDRCRQQQEEEARRQQEEQERRAAEEEEQRRAAAEEEERRRQEEQQRLAEQQRKEAEEAKRLEEERLQAEEHARQQQQQEATLHGQLDETADRAVHAATAAAGSAVGHPSNGLSAVVLFGYAAGEENEMTLNEGEVVVQIDQVDEGWWYGMSEDGKRQGLFPANYVQVLEEEPQAPAAPAAPPAPATPAAPVAAQPAPAPEPAHTSPPKQDQGATAIALYDYDAGEDNEISFREGQLITYIEFVSDDWWQGVAADGRTVGLFPANYVELQK
ncbi:related to drebrin f [Lichtheimia corymbifera JMRC:FSU:9682]|uniref:Related to drebrin f n=1 Tax=Lichtheimia corymbifera JMRC:FSU:9682 TaxID=1263082 RepID=A0A068RWM4_9FUNG|nr:related to drebrin f [Lichtheimia corymbifera JMRC:FSU:9682]